MERLQQEGQGFRATIESSKANVASQYTTLQNEYDTYRTSTQNDIRGFNDTLTKLKEDLARKDTEIEKATKKCRDYHAEIKGHQANWTPTSHYATLQKDLEECRTRSQNDIRRLKNDLAQLKEDLAEKDTQIESVKQKCREYQVEIKSHQANFTPTSRYATLQNENEEYRVGTENDIRDLKDTITRLEDTITRLKEDLARKDIQIENTQMECRDYPANIESHQTHFIARGEYESLQKKNEEYRAGAEKDIQGFKDALTQSENDLAEKNIEIENATKKCGDYQADIERFKTNFVAQSDYDALEQENRRLQNTLRERELEKETLQKSHSALQEELRQRELTFQEQLSALQQSKNVDQDISEKYNEMLTKSLEEARQREELTQHVVRVTAEGNTSKHDLQISEEKLKLEQAHHAILLEQHTHLKKTQSDLEAQLLERTGERDHLSAELLELKETIPPPSGDALALDDLRQRLDQAQNVEKDLSAEIEQLKEEKVRYISECAQEKGMLEARLAAQAEVSAVLNQITGSIDREPSGHVVEPEGRIQALEDELKRLAQENEHLRGDGRTRASETHTAQDLKRKYKQQAKLQFELQRTKTKAVDHLRERRRRMQKAHSKQSPLEASEPLQALRAQLDDLKRERAALETQLAAEKARHRQAIIQKSRQKSPKKTLSPKKKLSPKKQLSPKEEGVAPMDDEDSVQHFATASEHEKWALHAQVDALETDRRARAQNDDSLQEQWAMEREELQQKLETCQAHYDQHKKRVSADIGALESKWNDSEKQLALCRLELDGCRQLVTEEIEKHQQLLDAHKEVEKQKEQLEMALKACQAENVELRRRIQPVETLPGAVPEGDLPAGPSSALEVPKRVRTGRVGEDDPDYFRRLQEENDQLKTARKDLGDRVKSLEAVRGQQQAKIQTLTEESKTFETAWGASQDECRDTRQEKEKLEEKYEDVKRELKRLKQKRKTMDSTPSKLADDEIRKRRMSYSFQSPVHHDMPEAPPTVLSQDHESFGKPSTSSNVLDENDFDGHWDPKNPAIQWDADSEEMPFPDSHSPQEEVFEGSSAQLTQMNFKLLFLSFFDYHFKTCARPTQLHDDDSKLLNDLKGLLTEFQAQNRDGLMDVLYRYVMKQIDHVQNDRIAEHLEIKNTIGDLLIFTMNQTEAHMRELKAEDELKSLCRNHLTYLDTTTPNFIQDILLNIQLLMHLFDSMSIKDIHNRLSKLNSYVQDIHPKFQRYAGDVKLKDFLFNLLGTFSRNLDKVEPSELQMDI